MPQQLELTGERAISFQIGVEDHEVDAVLVLEAEPVHDGPRDRAERPGDRLGEDQRGLAVDREIAPVAATRSVGGSKPSGTSTAGPVGKSKAVSSAIAAAGLSAASGTAAPALASEPCSAEQAAVFRVPASASASLGGRSLVESNRGMTDPLAAPARQFTNGHSCPTAAAHLSRSPRVRRYSSRVISPLA